MIRVRHRAPTAGPEHFIRERLENLIRHRRQEQFDGAGRAADLRPVDHIACDDADYIIHGQRRKVVVGRDHHRQSIECDDDLATLIANIAKAGVDEFLRFAIGGAARGQDQRGFAGQQVIERAGGGAEPQADFRQIIARCGAVLAQAGDKAPFGGVKFNEHRRVHLVGEAFEQSRQKRGAD